MVETFILACLLGTAATFLSHVIYQADSLPSAYLSVQVMAFQRVIKYSKEEISSEGIYILKYSRNRIEMLVVATFESPASLTL